MTSSSALAAAHFDAKAGRYENALRACPNARVLEVLPFAMLLNEQLARPPHALVVADLLCGSGYLTRKLLQRTFGEVVGVDVSARMLKHFPRIKRTRVIHADLDMQGQLLRSDVKPDAIVALAGLHHIFELDATGIAAAASTSRQAAVLEAWASALPPDGVAIVADIPATLAPDSSSPSLTSPGRHGTLSSQIDRLVASTAGLVPAASRTLAEVRHAVQGRLPRVGDARPDAWFSEIVATQGVYGHSHHFLDVPGILERLRRAGITVAVHTLPVPWLFPDREHFHYFFYEKFALGPPANSAKDISNGVRDLIDEAVTQHLGLWPLAGTAVATGWRLCYLSLRRDR